MRFAWFLTISLAVLLQLLGSAAAANDWNRLTTVVFDEPVQVPGHVLQPGVYVFKLAELSGEHNVVQIWNADQTFLYATVMGFPEYVARGPADNQFVLEKNEGNAPKTLKTWFQAGNPCGERFVYPQKGAK
ncbi:MAG TPA: hypothetical protein VKY31_06035 [Terriglobia bacterium]|nr:hypothetical protein [Terriglobia bacterium]